MENKIWLGGSFPLIQNIVVISHSLEMSLLTIRDGCYHFLRKVLYILHGLFCITFTEIKLIKEVEKPKHDESYLNWRKGSKTWSSCAES